ncbi:MFS general substrate transporter [Myriangium duriaei CBS 260.36]|uniref:MFS general substrate transporter n=1 Tax=Myriangium duriaei CBS 260.36 TaxID=1168546 RepID=A0A9P4MNT0_9PEZI|nr:MFS general substrate transporter [Myriangium duriaei CBS 260.36]
MDEEKFTPATKAGQDSGASSIGSVPDPADYGVNEKSLLRKIDLKLLPGVVLLYLLSFLDRSNVANAKLDGLTTDLHMTGNEYLTGLTLFFIGYIAFEVIWNVILKRIGPKLWLPSITVVWGIITTLQGVVTNMTGFFVIRTFLGIAEGGLFPGVVFFLSQWYKRDERQYRIALFFSAASLAGAFGGILAYGIGFMDGVGGKRGWAWIFIIEGLVTFLIGLAGYWFISDWPSKSKFLTKDETAYIQARLKADSDATNDEAFTWHNVLSCLKDPKCWLYGLVFHTLSLPLYTLSLFLPSIIAALGYKAADAQLLTIPPYVLATILCVVYAVVSERYRQRAFFIAFSSLIGIIGYIILLTNTQPTKRPGVSYVGVFFCAAGIYPAVALGLSWPAMNVSGQTKRATANGLQITVGNLGAVIGTQLYRSNSGPRYIVGHSVALAYLAANIVVVGILRVILSRENKRRAALPPADEEIREWHGDEDPRWRFTY